MGQGDVGAVNDVDCETIKRLRQAVSCHGHLAALLKNITANLPSTVGGMGVLPHDLPLSGCLSRRIRREHGRDARATQDANAAEKGF
jgi:hypothetical protein